MEESCQEVLQPVSSVTGHIRRPADRQGKLSISVLGLGYVGTVTAACLAECGHRVIGVDVNPMKVGLINDGIAPIVEQGMSDLIRRVVHKDRLTAIQDVRRAVHQSDITLICVGTPSRPNGDLDLQYVQRVVEQVADALRTKDAYHTVVLRSTVLPGTTETFVLPILEQRSGKRVGSQIGLCVNPEFLREGSSLEDFHNPPFTLVGTGDDQAARILHDVYGWLDREFIVTNIRTAEMVKYINNGYHALKVAFANEVGRLCAALHIDSHQVMDIFCKDVRQNLSSSYLRPGYAFGGSCLPKDLRAILYKAKSVDVPMEVFQAVLTSNRTQSELGVQLVERAGRKKVGVLGLAFKPGTDDLRESPLVSLIETLLGRGYDVKVFDEAVCLARLMGSNKAYIEQELPHINQLLCQSIEEVVDHAETLVIGKSNPNYASVLNGHAQEKAIIDLVRIRSDLDQHPGCYQGIGW